MSTRDELAGVLADTLNKQFKDMKVAYFLDGSDTTPTDIKDFVSTGSTILDLAISNKPNGGIAVGRITEINGLESSGKSLLGAHILAETQKKGGVAVYIDTETSVSTEFLGAIGIDVESMLYLHLGESKKKTGRNVHWRQWLVLLSSTILVIGVNIVIGTLGDIRLTPIGTIYG